MFLWFERGPLWFACCVYCVLAAIAIAIAVVRLCATDIWAVEDRGWRMEDGGWKMEEWMDEWMNGR